MIILCVCNQKKNILRRNWPKEKFTELCIVRLFRLQSDDYLNIFKNDIFKENLRKR